MTVSLQIVPFGSWISSSNSLTLTGRTLPTIYQDLVQTLGPRIVKGRRYMDGGNRPDCTSVTLLVY